MQKYKSMSVGKIFNIINVFVFTTCMYIYDISSGVYSIFFAVVTAVVIDRVHLQNITMTMLIISKKEQLEDLIFKAVHRGVTKIKGIGAYSGEETNILLTVVSKDEALILLDVLPIAKARGFWDTVEPCYQKTVLRVLSTMDNALPIFIYYLREKKILSPSFFIFIAAFKSLS